MLNNITTINYKGLLISLEASPDLLELKLRCSSSLASGMSKITEDDLLKILKNEFISEKAVIPQALKNIVFYINNQRDVCKIVARGVSPIPQPLSNRIILLVKILSPESQKKLEIINQNHIRYFDNIEVGDIIARIYNELTVEAGMDIYGNIIKSKKLNNINNNQFEYDPNSFDIVTDSAYPEYHELIAKKNGYATIENNILLIKEEFIINNDVNLKSGNIDFVGNVRVNGNLQREASVVAKGDIYISGDVFGTVISLNGSITVGGVIYGETKNILTSNFVAVETLKETSNYYNRSQVIARNSITANRADNTLLEAYGDVIIHKEIRNCKINTSGKVITQGLLYAGKIYSVLGVEARRIGSPSEITTEIILCNNIEFSTDYIKLTNEIEENNKNLELTKVCLGVYLTNPQKVKELKGNYKRNIEVFLSKYYALLSYETALKETQTKLLLQATNTQIAKVTWSDKLFPGVVIRLNKHNFSASQIMFGPKSIQFFDGAEDWTISSLT
ncbi:MAG: FapA family protein [Deltaproteobacteria bacterium]|nr:FapA family protein [Deltaproteobacteria bacterium]